MPLKPLMVTTLPLFQAADRLRISTPPPTPVGTPTTPFGLPEKLKQQRDEILFDSNSPADYYAALDATATRR